MNRGIAIVGMACRYPDASTPAELWENALAGRQAFRRIPPERLRLEDYFSTDHDLPDSIYSAQAAVIEGYEFDRARFRVGKTTYESADLAHWLALDIACQALEDAGFSDRTGFKELPKTATGVYVGNTLTGEFARANSLRLRWPYVRRVLEATLPPESLSAIEHSELLRKFEQLYKLPFPPANDETLAGNLSNTIAGRICNYFDLKGGGYCIDGACASSLLAVSTACSALASGDVNVALAGGVDISIDPFELVGFAKTAALAPGLMRVFDRRSSGFLPGEGCGFVVLMPLDEARRQSRQVYAVIKGWGTSSDGAGGITRPEVDGQLLALERAHRRAGYGADSVAYFEAHGTGTPVGDETELRVLGRAHAGLGFGLDGEAGSAGCDEGWEPRAPSEGNHALIGSIKANIGHTKAAAGVAGLIKTVKALESQIIPPTVGCQQPHRLLCAPQSSIKVSRRGALWPRTQPLRAGVSAMGFGGINCHIALEAASLDRREAISTEEQVLLRSEQDMEILLIAAHHRIGLLEKVTRLLPYSSRLSRSEIGDLAAELQRQLAVPADAEPALYRAALIVASADELKRRLESLRSWLDQGVSRRLDPKAGVFMGTGGGLRIGFLFPGQASPVYPDGGALGRRFAEVEDFYSTLDLPAHGDTHATEVAQPAIVAGSLAGLRLMRRLGIKATVAVGHSLGEIVALHWGGCYDERAVMAIAAARSAAMTQPGISEGAMVAIRAGKDRVRALLNGDPVSIACTNGPRNTVISGAHSAIAAFTARATAAGLATSTLPVTRAFHSSLIAPAADSLRKALVDQTFLPLSAVVISTVTGSPVSPSEDIHELLCRQITAPVCFVEAASAASEFVDLFVEVGPGNVISGLMSDICERPAIALDVGGDSINGLLEAAGAAFACGVEINHSALFESRFTRAFNLDWKPSFFRNPCEMAPIPAETADPAGNMPADREPPHEAQAALTEEPADASVTPDAVREADIPTMIRRMIAERAELPYESVRPDDRMLADLHFNSITVSRIIVEASRRLGLSPPVSPTDYANVTVADMAAALEESRRNAQNPAALQNFDKYPPGIASWVHCFRVDLVERPLEAAGTTGAAPASEWKLFIADGHPSSEALAAALAGKLSGNGVLVAVSKDHDDRDVEMLLQAAREVLTSKTTGQFVLLQHNEGAAGLARSLYLEAPQVNVSVVVTPWGHPRTPEWVAAEARAARGYTEAHYDSGGVRRVPELVRISLDEKRPDHLMLNTGDVVLVTGGGKGIAAECALALARQTGCRLVLIGRSDPSQDLELAANLERFKKFGVRVRYVSADVTNSAAVQRAIAAVAAEVGPVTCILHGAGRNQPALLASLTTEEFRATLAPKVEGLRNVLAAVDPRPLKALIGFGSLIARAGMRGEAHYAAANERLRELIETWQTGHPECRCLVIEWSVWAGAGMGERLGTIDRLAEQGISAISLDEGVRLFTRLLHEPQVPVSLVATNRFGSVPTLRTASPRLPFRRFLEQIRVYYPGIELITDCEVSSTSDPYLDEHVFDGNRLFPAVMGLEAMAQVAMALTGTDEIPRFESVVFTRPIALPESGPLVIRIAALKTGCDAVEVAIRSSETAFQTDHFCAVCRFDRDADGRIEGESSGSIIGLAQMPSMTIDLEPRRELYGCLLFHQGRFQRVRGYRRITSTGCIAEIGAGEQTSWFSRFLPSGFALGDPAERDAVIHAIQVCVPDATLLPVAVKKITFGWAREDPLDYCSSVDEPTNDRIACLVTANETARNADVYTYDVSVSDQAGRVLEFWEGLKLRTVAPSGSANHWVAPLLGSYIERVVRDRFNDRRICVAIDRASGANVIKSNGTRRTEIAIGRALGQNIEVIHRPDGKPESLCGAEVSASHCSEVTFAVAAKQNGLNGNAKGPARLLACDAESVISQPTSIWRNLLGDRFSLAESIARADAPRCEPTARNTTLRATATTPNEGESDGSLNALDVAATRVWCISECIKKAGLAIDAPVVIDSETDDGWVFLRSGSCRIGTYSARLAASEEQKVFAILAG